MMIDDHDDDDDDDGICQLSCPFLFDILNRLHTFPGPLFARLYHVFWRHEPQGIYAANLA